jgi:hypothetical protein
MDGRKVLPGISADRDVEVHGEEISGRDLEYAEPAGTGAYAQPVPRPVPKAFSSRRLPPDPNPDILAGFV